jgi:hypothetical protein
MDQAKKAMDQAKKSSTRLGEIQKKETWSRSTRPARIHHHDNLISSDTIIIRCYTSN